MAANTIAGRGFQEIAPFGGGAPNYAMAEQILAYNNSSSIGFGDPVVMNASGQIDLYVRGGAIISGVAQGFKYLNPNGFPVPFQPAWTVPSLNSLTVVTAKVVINPEQVFACQCSGSALTQSAVGNNIDIYSGTSGAPGISGQSTCLLDAGGIGTTLSLPFKIVGIVGLTSGISAPAINSSYDPTGDNNWVLVKMNTSSFLTATGI